VVATSSPSPALGVRILDGYASLPLGVSDPRAVSLDDPGTATSSDFTRANPRSTSVQRTFLPSGPDVIHPGPAAFRAWFGDWVDLDGDFVIDVVYDAHGFARGAGNEWAVASAATTSLVAYVEPGSHPSPADLERPDASVPDFDYEVAGVVWRGSVATPGELKAIEIGPIFVDGSLLQRYEVLSVSDAILAPGERLPFTPTASSLVDIDVYAAMAPGPVASLYGLASPTINAVGSPGLSYCPNACRTGPVPLGDTPLAPVAGPVEGLVWAPYPQETRPGEGSSSSGRHGDHLARYTPWLDLLPGHHDSLYVERHTKGSAIPFGPGPLRGRDADGGQAMAPGLLGFEARIGVWMDINGDGFVGVATTPDAYEHGSRPRGDRYDRPGGEYFGADAVDAAGKTAPRLTIRLAPVEDWGPRGVYLCPLSVQVATCLNAPSSHYTGATPITMSATGDPTTRGLYLTTLAVLFPEGTAYGGFTACIDAAYVSHVDAGGPTVTAVHDCDVVGRLATV